MNSQQEHIHDQLTYNLALADARIKQLEAKVKAYLNAEDAYYKSGKDSSLLRKKMAIRAELKELVYPKKDKVSQAIIDWLAS